MRDRETMRASRQNEAKGARSSGGLKPFLRLLARIRPSKTLLAAALALSIVNTDHQLQTKESMPPVSNFMPMLEKELVPK